MPPGHHVKASGSAGVWVLNAKGVALQTIAHRTLATREGHDLPARAFREASRKLGRPVISLRTDDCQRDAERLKAKGVVFVREPARMDYGGMDAVFDDTCGNLINLHQD